MCSCIVKGSFRATYPVEKISLGVLVVVKRLSVGQFLGIQQFHAGIKSIGRFRNPNFMKLIGYHAPEMEMFLIYNFLLAISESFNLERSTLGSQNCPGHCPGSHLSSRSMCVPYFSL
ncbi:hypothetical protein Nepgr_029297 [Nepenthes gracilis]|uniref:Uncharacterized protein n=1 Tax=Nepenthes gracilis TaxID=150966 RepID=A0AAD3TED0_NEPGR|nr:hypothetical protein Nepgr_029297 [Nepenthes gracilis]